MGHVWVLLYVWTTSRGDGLSLLHVWSTSRRHVLSLLNESSRRWRHALSLLNFRRSPRMCSSRWQILPLLRIRPGSLRHSLSLLIWTLSGRHALTLLRWKGSRLHELTILCACSHVRHSILTHRHLLERWILLLLLLKRHVLIHRAPSDRGLAAWWERTWKRWLLRLEVCHICLWRQVLAYRKILQLRHLLCLHRPVALHFIVL